MIITIITKKKVIGIINNHVIKSSMFNYFLSKSALFARYKWQYIFFETSAAIGSVNLPF